MVTDKPNDILSREQIIQQQYKRTHPGCSIRITALIPTTSDGTLATVKRVTGGETVDELCFLSSENTVTIHSITDELARQLERRQKQIAQNKKGLVVVVAASIFESSLLVLGVSVVLLKIDLKHVIYSLTMTLSALAVGWVLSETVFKRKDES